MFGVQRSMPCLMSCPPDICQLRLLPTGALHCDADAALSVGSTRWTLAQFARHKARARSASTAPLAHHAFQGSVTSCVSSGPALSHPLLRTTTDVREGAERQAGSQGQRQHQNLKQSHSRALDLINGTLTWAW